MKITNVQENRVTSSLSRRRFVKRFLATGAATSLFQGMPAGWVGNLYADDSPERADVRFGVIALTDCSPIVIAHEKGFFKKYGIRSTVSKGANWAAIRDSLSNGDYDSAHMLFGMPIASTIGLLGSPKKPMIIPWLLNRNGQAITLKREWAGKIGSDPKAIKPFVDQAKAKGEPLTFAMTFPPGTHAMWMRYYLAAGGVHPDRDIALITIPPPQMVANMRIGKMDGFCVGEPWNERAIVDKVGFTSISTQSIWKDHPEKVCAFTAEFADSNPRTVKAVLKSLHDASVWLDELSNRPEQCEIVSRPTYINCPKDVILGRMLGDYDMGDGRVMKDENYMIFNKRNCNYPQPKYCAWWLSQFRRWGMVSGTPDYPGISGKVMRPDIYEEAMKEIGYAHGGVNTNAETFFDGKAFDPNQAEEYAKSFSIHSIKG